MILHPFTGYTFHGHPEAEESEEAMIDAKAEYESLVKAAGDVASPLLICVLEPDGLHCYDNIIEDGDIEDLKAILCLAAVMVCEEVKSRQGSKASEAVLDRLVAACI